MSVYRIREQDPLKQGLKLIRGCRCGHCGRIREQDPLKQGLKPPAFDSLTKSISDSRARSTKTRIETYRADTSTGETLDSRARSTKTRIETLLHSHFERQL